MVRASKRAIRNIAIACAIFVGSSFVLILLAAYALDRMYQSELLTDYAPDFQTLGPGGGFLGLESIPESAREVHGQYDMDSTTISGTFYIDLADTESLVSGFVEIVRMDERVRRAKRFAGNSLTNETRVFVRRKKDSDSELREEILLIDAQSGFVNYSNHRVW